MSIRVHLGTHLDHGLSAEHVKHVLYECQDLPGPFIVTIDLPTYLPEVPCHLHGPAVGEPPVAEDEVTYARRGDRRWPSRIVDRPPTMTRKVTVVAGSCEDGGALLYTAYGGPPAPREDTDPNITDLAAYEEARAFWAEHALSR